MSTRKTANPPAIGRVIKTWRRRRKLTQKELAAKTGLPPATVSSFERGESVPSTEDRKRICAALDVVPGDFDQEVFWIEKQEGFAAEPSAPEKLSVEELSDAWDNLKPLFLKLVEWVLRKDEAASRREGRKP